MAISQNKTKPTPQRRFVGEAVIAEVTGRRIRTLQKDRLYGDGPFPHYKVKRQVLYDLDECIAIVKASRVGKAAA